MNNTSDPKKDSIICNQINKNDIVLSSFENNYVLNFYDKCNKYTNFYICERTQTPNKFDIEDNFICPDQSYITKLVVFCLLNILINLMCNFLPTKLEYNKYIEVINIYNPRTTNRKSNSFNSTFNSSEMPKNGENIETDDKFVRTPTEILIVCNNRNNLVNNNLTKVNKKKENNINNINNDNSNNNENELVIKKSKSRKIDITNAISLNKEKTKNNQYKSSKNVRNNLDNINKINVNKKDHEKKSKFKNDENKLNLSFDDTISISTKRVILPKPKNNNFKDD